MKHFQIKYFKIRGSDLQRVHARMVRVLILQQVARRIPRIQRERLESCEGQRPFASWVPGARLFWQLHRPLIQAVTATLYRGWSCPGCQWQGTSFTARPQLTPAQQPTRGPQWCPSLSGPEASANQDRGLTSNPLGAPHYKPLWESSLLLWTQGIFSTHILVSQFLRGRNRRGSRAKAPQVSECPRLTLPLGPSSLGAHQG